MNWLKANSDDEPNSIPETYLTFQFQFHFCKNLIQLKHVCKRVSIINEQYCDKQEIFINLVFIDFFLFKNVLISLSYHWIEQLHNILQR